MKPNPTHSILALLKQPLENIS